MGVGDAERERSAARLHGGGGVLVDREAEWHAVYRFASEGTARAWEDSAARAHWDIRAADFARQTERRSVRGSKAWFDSQTRHA